jgi:lanosterol synthase
MSHLAARRFTIPSNPLLDQIREEIYIESYSTINFSSFRGVVLPCHGHQEKSWILKVLFWVLVNIWMPYLCPKAISQRAEATTYNLIKLTNEATNFTGIISVDKFLMLISCYAQEGPDSTHVRRHQETSFEYLWIESQGMQVMSVHSGQIWDASLTLQAMIQAGLGEKPEFNDSISRAHDFVAQQQYLVDWPNPETCFRASRLGGWPFGAKHQGYAVSDCTAEALKAVLILQGPLKYPNLVSEQRIKLAVDNLLRNQNSSGGLSTYEPNRATPLLEHLNATELFRKVMVEYDHIECTSSAVTALDLFRNLGNEYRSKEVNRSIDRGIQFIRQSQRDDGSWLGHWGVCFTYAAMFALEALAVAGETYDNSSRVKLACDFLLGKQKADGGWGELVEVGILAYSHHEHASG